MKILVTGGNGFIGRSLVKFLVQQGHSVHVLGFKDQGVFQNIPIVGFYENDISSPFSISEHFDLVFHLAAYNITSIGEVSEEIYYKVNVLGTKHVLEGIKTGKFVFLSTVKVYGRHAGLIDEQSPVFPVGLYEKSKFKAEELCRQLLDEKHLVIFRSVNIIGPGQAPKAVIPVFIRQAIQHEPITVFGPRGVSMQFVFVEDALQALMKALDERCQGLYNISSDEVIQLEDLVSCIKEICFSSSAVQFKNNEPQPAIKYSYTKLKKILGWQPKVTLEAALRECYKAYAE